MRLIRSSMLEVLDSEFVKLARLKGLSEFIVILKHGLRNALIPVLTLFVFLATLITGAIVTETVFAWPGVGQLTLKPCSFETIHCRRPWSSWMPYSYCSSPSSWIFSMPMSIRAFVTHKVQVFP